MKIRNIIVGWYNRIFDRNTTLYNKRMEVCKGCTEKVKIGNEDVCGICYCPLKSKLRVKEEVCAQGRW